MGQIIAIGPVLFKQVKPAHFGKDFFLWPVVLRILSMELEYAELLVEPRQARLTVEY